MNFPILGHCGLKYNRVKLSQPYTTVHRSLDVVEASMKGITTAAADMDRGVHSFTEKVSFECSASGHWVDTDTRLRM